MKDKTTIEVPIPLNNRLLDLAKGRAQSLGISTLSRPKFLEMLISEEEKRVQNAVA